MSIRNRLVSSTAAGCLTIGATLVILGSLVVPSSSAAGIENGKHTRVESMARIPEAKSQTRPGESLKCYQEGRLVFEAANLETSDEEQPSGIEIRTKGGQLIRLLDLQQGMCILQKRASK